MKMEYPKFNTNYQFNGRGHNSNREKLLKNVTMNPVTSKTLTTSAKTTNNTNKLYDSDPPSPSPQSRDSISRALKVGDFRGAKQKVMINLELINSHLNDLQDHSYHYEGLNSDVVIKKLGQIFNETHNYINHYLEFKFRNRIDKIENIKEAKILEQKCNKYKIKFDTTIKKLSQLEKESNDSYKEKLSLTRNESKNRNTMTSLRVPSVSPFVVKKKMSAEEGDSDTYFMKYDGKNFIEGKDNSLRLMEDVSNQVNRYSIRTEEKIKQTAKEHGIEDIDITDIPFKTRVDKELLFKDPPSQLKLKIIVLTLITVTIVSLFYFTNWHHADHDG